MKILKLILATALLLNSNWFFSQTDTVYLDIRGQKTTIERAGFYRIIFPLDNLFEARDYFLDGTLSKKATYTSFEPEIKSGDFQNFYKNGKLYEEGKYANNLEEGIWKEYNILGNLVSVRNYKAGKLHGEFTTYFTNGICRRRENYEEGKFITGVCFNMDEEEIAFIPYEQRAEFQGGNKALNEYISKNINYPRKARRKGIQGKVIVRFTIGENGKVSNVHVVSHVHELLDDEAIRVVSGMPAWIPGKQEGDKIMSFFDLPVNFVLD